MTQLTFQHPERLWITGVVLAVAFGALWLGYQRSALRGGLRLAALGCKAAVWALLALMLADPVWSRKQPKIGENEVVVVADNSASLTVAEESGKPSRADALRSALGANPGAKPGELPAWLNQLGVQFRVKTHVVDERLQTVADFTRMDFQGQKSELARALKTLRAGGPGSRLGAVVLLSDGTPTDAEAWQATEGTAPVFPVLVGARGPTPDLALLDLSVAQTSFEDTPVTVTARVGAAGFAGKEVAVCALDEQGKNLATEKLRPGKEGTPLTARLRIPAVKPGVSFYRIAVMAAEHSGKTEKDAWKEAARAQEAVLQNNERLICVDRGQGPYRILYLAGRPNWEYKFLRRALAGDVEIQMPSLIRIAKREPKFEWRGRAGENSNPLFRGFGQEGVGQRYDEPVLTRLGTRDATELSDGFPKAADNLFGEYRAIIIDDLEAEFFTQEQMNLIERFVSERGGALLMLGGQECYQAGGYEHTPVGRMLPVYLDRVTQAAPIENGRFNLTREGWLEPWARLRADRAEDEKRLVSMPGFYAVNEVFSIKPGASILATVSADGGGQDAGGAVPALAVQRFGEGRVAALTLADVWRWGLRDAETHKDMDRQWRQLMRWLVVDVPDRVDFTATAEQGRMKLAVRVRDKAFRPMDDAQVKLEVTGPGGKKSTLYGEPSLKEAGLFEAEFFPREPGAYRATATVENTSPTPPDGTPPAEKVIATKTTGWAHDPLPAEFASLAPGRDWMERVARETGGQMLTLEDLDRLPALLQDIRVPVEETLTTPLWHTSWMFVLILALLTLEWFLRRKGGVI